MIYSCIDIGGTAIKFGLVDETGRFHKKGSLPTEAATGGGPGIVHKVRSLIQRQLADHPLAGIGISTAGIIDTERGAVDYALSIPDYTGTAWKSLLENEFQLPCIVENDTNCAALGEWWLGVGRDMDSLFAVTVGTSIGGAFIEKGHILHGACRSAGEIAYMRVPAGRLHDVASATYLCREMACKKPPTRKRSTAVLALPGSVREIPRQQLSSIHSARIWPMAWPISPACAIPMASSSAAASWPKRIS